MKVKYWILSFAIFCICQQAFAQPIRVSLPEFPDREFKNPSFKKTSNSSLRTEATALALPFWEDFSDTASLGNHFKPNTGIYFNNHLCINQPSVNVATFDGLNDKGKPYYTSNVYQMGEADSLVSLDIDLSSASPQDSLYFGFQYQIAGFGEVPDLSEGDSLILQFYTKEGKWKSVWQSNFSKAVDTAVFYPILLKVIDSSYFHPNFKFKFFNYARLSGMFDLWHVDYIVMDTVHSTSTSNVRQLINGQLYFSDLAISKSPTSIITPYQSIPVNHITSLPFSTTFNFTISNLSNNINTIEPAYQLELKSASDSLFGPRVAGDSPDIPPGIHLVNQLFTFGISPVAEEFELISKVFVQRIQPGNSGNYLFENNDTVTSVFPFRNYYAYDDGEYEYGVRFDQINALQAVGYDAYEQDTITHIDMCIPYIGYDIQGSAFYLKIWADDNGKPGQELYSNKEYARYYSDTTSASYSTGQNPFTRYAITKQTVVVNNRFYVGFKQLQGNKKAIRLGFDANNNRKDRFWYDNNQGSGWSQFRNLNGAMMIRPVFANNAPNIANLKKFEEDDYTLEIHPNPNNTGILYLNGIYDRVQISDTKGRIWINEEFVDSINIQSLDSDVYIVKAFLNGNGSIKRLVYQRN